MITIKSEAQIELMRKAGKLLYEVECELREAIDRYEERRKQGDLAGYRTNHRGAEITRMRDAMHQYQLEKMKQDVDHEG